jgi:uncharacterized membrane protein
MESRIKAFGHPVHPMLIPLPLGLLVMAVVFDGLVVLAGQTGLAIVSFWDIVGGLVGGAAAAIFGWLDWRAIPGGTRAKRVGLLHGIGNVVMLTFFLLSVLIRQKEPGFYPRTMAMVLEIAGFALGAFTGWLGGELVDRLGVGVDEGANVNAPSSLSGRPARV